MPADVHTSEAVPQSSFCLDAGVEEAGNGGEVMACGEAGVLDVEFARVNTEVPVGLGESAALVSGVGGRIVTRPCID